MENALTIHVVFRGRDLRHLKELQLYLGHTRELGEPETVSEAVRFAVNYCWKQFDRAARRSQREERAG